MALSEPSATPIMEDAQLMASRLVQGNMKTELPEAPGPLQECLDLQCARLNWGLHGETALRQLLDESPSPTSVQRAREVIVEGFQVKLHDLQEMSRCVLPAKDAARKSWGLSSQPTFLDHDCAEAAGTAEDAESAAAADEAAREAAEAERKAEAMWREAQQKAAAAARQAETLRRSLSGRPAEIEAAARRAKAVAAAEARRAAEEAATVQAQQKAKEAATTQARRAAEEAAAAEAQRAQEAALAEVRRDAEEAAAAEAQRAQEAALAEAQRVAEEAAAAEAQRAQEAALAEAAEEAAKEVALAEARRAAEEVTAAEAQRAEVAAAEAQRAAEEAAAERAAVKEASDRAMAVSQARQSAEEATLKAHFATMQETRLTPEALRSAEEMARREALRAGDKAAAAVAGEASGEAAKSSRAQQLAAIEQEAFAEKLQELRVEFQTAAEISAATMKGRIQAAQQIADPQERLQCLQSLQTDMRVEDAHRFNGRLNATLTMAQEREKLKRKLSLQVEEDNRRASEAAEETKRLEHRQKCRKMLEEAEKSKQLALRMLQESEDVSMEDTQPDPCQAPAPFISKPAHPPALPSLTPLQQSEIDQAARTSMSNAASRIISECRARGESSDSMQKQLLQHYDAAVQAITKETLKEVAAAKCAQEGGCGISRCGFLLCAWFESLYIYMYTYKYIYIYIGVLSV